MRNRDGETEIETRDSSTQLDGARKPFVGRRRELSALVDRPRSGLTTIIGPGGVGKTTLAWHAAQILREEEFPDGVFAVRLAPIADPDLVAAEVAASVGLPRTSGLGYERAIVEWLRDRRALLILDNCEHVIDGAAELAELLTARLPDLALLATSREPLEASGETMLRLSAFETPEEGSTPEDLEGNEAIRLFVGRARAREPEFETDEQALDEIAGICRALDGLPLAIELAAARIGTLPLADIRARLEDRIGFLVNRSRSAEDRHRTLHATAEWSFGLLEPEEQAVFRRLAVFAGGFDLDGAVAVNDGELPAEQVEEIVFRLVDKSLLFIPDPGLARYRMLETVRRFAFGKLEGAGEISATRDRHANLYLDVGVKAAGALQSGPERPWLELLRRDHDNLRAALEHMLRGDSPDRALALSASLGMFWWTTGHTREGIDWTERSLAAATTAPGELRAAGFFGMGFLWAHDTDDWMRAAEILDEGVALAEAQQSLESPILGYLLCLRGQAANFAGEHRMALDLTSRGTEIIEGFGDPWGTGFGLWNVGFSLRHLGDDEEARERFERMARIQREHGIGLVLMIACQSLAEIDEEQGDPESALSLYEEALALRRDLGAARLGNIHGSLPSGLVAVARNAAASGDVERAMVTAGEALPLAEEIRDEEIRDEARSILRGEDPLGSHPVAVFERQGMIWRISFDGEEGQVADSKGMRQIRELIARPGNEIGAVTLAAAIDGTARDLGDSGELLDQQAIDQYRRRLGEIEAEIEQAGAFNDPERAATAAEERDALIAELARATGMGGRQRRAGSSVERARVNVTRTLRNAITRVEEVVPSLGRHLDSSIRTGNFCVYEPSAPITWRL